MNEELKGTLTAFSASEWKLLEFNRQYLKGIP